MRTKLQGRSKGNEEEEEEEEGVRTRAQGGGTRDDNSKQLFSVRVKSLMKRPSLCCYSAFHM
jgi:hypothetical protein